MTRKRRYLHRLRERLEAQLGGKCRDCGQTWGLEFAHTGETGLNGRGRGSWERLKNVRDHIDKYTLLCQPCHQANDGPMYMNPHYKKGNDR